MTAAVVETTVVEELRARIRGMETSSAGALGASLPTHPALSGLVQLRAGGSYEVDSLSLALTLMAEASGQGAWSAVIGIGDLGLEAAVELGVDLARTVLVPDPGDHWAEVIAVMAEVVTIVVVRPPARVTEKVASRIGARLRNGSAALVVWGSWPRCDARLALAEQEWLGPGRGEGRLLARRALVAVRRGAGAVRRSPVWLPAEGGAVTCLA